MLGLLAVFSQWPVLFEANLERAGSHLSRMFVLTTAEPGETLG